MTTNDKLSQPQVDELLEASRAAFREEAYELLGELETALMELEEAPQDMDLVNRVFRAMHTIKGSGAMFGFDAISAFTHDVETVFDLVREGKIAVTGDLIGLSLDARDQIRTMLDNEGDPVRQARLTEGFQALLPSGKSPSPAQSAPQAGQVPDPACQNVFRIRFKPHLSLLQNGTNPILLLDELRSLGECTVVAQTDHVPALADLDPETCTIYWDAVLTTDRDENAIQDVFIFVEDLCDLTVQRIVAADTDETPTRRLGEILVERGDVSEAQIQQAMAQQKRLGQILVDQAVVDAGKVEAALAEQDHLRRRKEKEQEPSQAATIRVAAEKLDSLVDLVGELVTVQARLSRKAMLLADNELTGIAELVDRLTAELRDNTMSVRMLPIGTSVARLKRLVRDLSRDLKKDVTLTVEGGDTELDKTVIEQLSDPLVHIIRNSLDHGIESPDQREAVGKPRQGTVHLSAGHEGANVVIRIADDGAGIDPAAVRAKAIEKGLITEDADIAEKDIFNLVFAPGFSTAMAVTSISGRGVGMDVVKRSIENLRGAIEMESRLGAGTTITLKLPLTLAIIDGLVVDIARENYVLPLAAVEECVELSQEGIEAGCGRHIINIRDQIVPYIQLRERFGLDGPRPAIEQIVINEVDGRRVGLVVDRVIGQHQVVIKTMSKMYKNVDEISGATILGDGSVALILDVPKLVQNTAATH